MLKKVKVANRPSFLKRMIKIITKPKIEIRVGMRTRLKMTWRERYYFWKPSIRKIFFLLLFIFIFYIYLGDMAEHGTIFNIYGEYKVLIAIEKEFDDYMKAMMKEFEGFL